MPVKIICNSLLATILRGRDQTPNVCKMMLYYHSYSIKHLKTMPSENTLDTIKDRKLRFSPPFINFCTSEFPIALP